MKPATAILIGSGDRGVIYAAYALRHPDRLRIVALAEPVTERRRRAARLHGIPDSNVFVSWEELLDRPLMADGAIIATQDAMHTAPAVGALARGYHVLLEKPMALTEEECLAIVGAAEASGRGLCVCHVLRYTALFRAVKDILDSGTIGRVHTMYHAENVAYYHMAHSYVRGNWRRNDESSPMILAKCSHDLDLLYWFAGSPPRSIASAGGLDHFTAASAPPGAPGRCTDGCPAAPACPYEAVATYLYGVPLKKALAMMNAGALSLAAKILLGAPGLSRFIPGLRAYARWREWPTSTITDDLSGTGVMRALREGPYGRCVYRCDNDQVDHQETVIGFENGATAVLRMHGFSAIEGRTLRIDGSAGTLRARFGAGGDLEVALHGYSRVKRYPVRTDLLGHSEGDEGIMDNYVSVLAGGSSLTSARESLQSHLMAFAADRARVEGRVVRL
ncbi:MAG TPA: Gfo/Idh/MocA family oxidoreductase [Spirochaetota bacterium]|nr:Gfo/Idh/MocA family oxidoreductase [Spirochaetota bacterium]